MLAMAAIVVMIAYGSLYPFAFHTDGSGAGPFAVLFGSWNRMPGRGDFVSNILLYLPLGFAGMLVRGSKLRSRRFALTTVLGMALSLSVELLQYYDAGRDTEATDFYANTLGTLLGATGGLVLGQDFRWPFFREISANRIPVLLLAAWVGYRLYPYVPTIDLHKYWHALKPVVLYPHLTPLGLYRQTAIWLCICALSEKIAGRRWTGFYWLFAGFVLFASILIISTWLSIAQLAGIALGFLVWRMLRAVSRAHAAAVVAFMLAAYIFAHRLEPFQFAWDSEHFSWTPFLSFMQGSIDTDVQSFLEKFFLYGGLVWLLIQAGVSARFGTLMVAALLLATSGLETFIPGRSAEVTDAILALAAGWVVGAGSPGLLDDIRPTTLTGYLETLAMADDLAGVAVVDGELQEPGLHSVYETAAG